MKNKLVGGVLFTFLLVLLFTAGRWTAAFITAWREKDTASIEACIVALVLLVFVVILLISLIHYICFCKDKTNITVWVKPDSEKLKSIKIEGKVVFSAQQLLDELQKFKDQGYNLDNQICFVDEANNHIPLKNVGLTHISGKDDWVEVF